MITFVRWASRDNQRSGIIAICLICTFLLPMNLDRFLPFRARMSSCHPPLEALCHPRRHKGISSYCRAVRSPVRYELELGARNGVFLSSNGPENAWRSALMGGILNVSFSLAP